MADDPAPWLRCRCVHRHIFIPELAHLLAADPYYDRCGDRPAGEDGLCDHCRLPQGEPHACGRWPRCCRTEGARRLLVPLDMPCQAAHDAELAVLP